MASTSKETRGRNPADRFTDDILLLILSRLPVKSICRFKCVSPAWRNLISHPDYRKKLLQTLPGFFYHTYSRERESARHFTNITGRGAPLVRPSLSFLPGYSDITVLDCCNGILLCHRRTAGAIRYVVCNPATEEWAELPESSEGAAGNICTARLGFDPAVSPHFHVFEFLETDVDPATGYIFIDGLGIYSSNTREWAHRDSGWSGDASLCHDMSSVFFEGFLHVFASHHQDVLVVDTEGKVWRTIAVPHGNDDGFIGQSQGCLYYINTVEDHDFKLPVYALEDYATDEWIFKHSVRTSMLLGKSVFSLMQYYNLVTIHPECNMIFFISDVDNTLRCYDMDRRKVRVICNMGCQRHWENRCLPYVPLFSKSLMGLN